MAEKILRYLEPQYYLRMKNTVITIEDKLGNVPFFIDRFHEKIKKTRPHKHDDYYELIFLNEGEGFHWIETEEYGITAPEFYFLKPGQFHYWQFTSIPKGFVIMFKTSYFNKVQESFIINIFRQLSDTFRIDIPEGYSPGPILQAMMEEFSKPTEFSVDIIHGLLTALVSKMLQLARMQPVEKLAPEALFNRFMDLVFKECLRHHHLDYYAEILNSTKQNLNAACRKYSDKSAGEHIMAQLLLEAKRYILHTECTISEIANILTFNDASYFGKFFKLHEGISPAQFRARYPLS
jgi:AraC family transcriptional regulator, transcriptional activator of pobA